ncbi:MAG: cold shock domain-containing protein [bacterium]
MAKGVVKFFDKRKGFGFIKPDGGERDCYVNEMDVQGRELNEGDIVEFSVEIGKKGPRAKNVTKIG